MSYRNIWCNYGQQPLLRRYQLPYSKVSIYSVGALLLLGVTNASWAQGVLAGRVVGLADGDTVTVLDASLSQHKVRVAGIDAPEKRQPFGNRSKAHLSALLIGKPVEVEWQKKDRYGRIVGVVRVNGTDAGLEQVRAGMAWHYKAYEKEQKPADRKNYADAENEARAARRGLWVDKSPQSPWAFRADKRPQRSAL